MKKKFLLLLLLYFIAIESFTQTLDIKAIRKELQKSKNDSVKLVAYHLLSLAYAENKDSSEYYYKQMSEFFNKNEEKFSHVVTFYIAANYTNSNLFSFAEKYFEEAIKKAYQAKDYDHYIDYSNSYGYMYRIMAQYEKSITILLKNLKFIEKQKLNKHLPVTYIYLAFSFRDYGNVDKSLEYFEKSYQTGLETSDSTYIHVNLHEIGNIYSLQNDFATALKYQLEALKIRENLKQSKEFYLMISYNDVSITYTHLGEYKKGIEMTKKGLDIAEKRNNKQLQCALMLNIADLYLRIEILSSSESWYKKAIEMAKQAQIIGSLEIGFKGLSQLYSYLGNYEQAYRYQDSAIRVKDSIFSFEKSKAIEELNMEYETDKKEQENLILKKKREAQEAVIQKQRIAGTLIILVLMLMVFLAVVFFKGREKQRLANRLLHEKNVEIERKNGEIQAQSEAINKQKLQLEKSHEKIKDSINYASRIQRALLPSAQELNQQISEHFVLYKPKDIVSGDFYYYKQIGNQIVIAVADCTGHGVPGAFVSMLGIAFLNEIVKIHYIQSAAQILEDLREKVKTSLKQTKESETKDGMDIALCLIDTQTLVLQYAGAYNPLYLLRNKELIEIKATKNPIAVFIKEKPFENNELQLQKEDKIYMFSDGYVDQFGGQNNTKFLSSNFKKLFQEICEKPLAEQREILNEKIETWRSNFFQNDDILVLGLKIN
jgi:serine phosphatase RsbU (regulator of sigma subunit)